MLKQSVITLFIFILIIMSGCTTSRLPDASPVITGTVENVEGTSKPPPSPTPAPVTQTYNEYDIILDINPETRTVQGIERVNYINKTGMELEKIFFNIYLNAFNTDSDIKPYFDIFENNIFKHGKDYGYVNILNVSINNEDIAFNLNNTSLELVLNEPLKTRASLEITLQFEAYIPLISHRIGADDEAGAMWFGSFLPVLAVYDEFGWHREPYYPAGEPFYTDISNYTVKITTPSNYTVIAPGSKTVTESENKKRTVCTAELVRDFSFAIGKYYTVDSITIAGDIDVNVYHYNELDTDKILKTASEFLDYYGRALGSYPYHELNIIECELFAQTGMAYSQMIFMDTDYLQNENSIESIAYHTACQWFGCIIGSNRIKESWLDKGMAIFLRDSTFCEDDKLLEIKLLAEYASLGNKMKEFENRSLLQDLSVYKNWDEYYNIQYIRSKLMVYSLRLRMGNEKFNDFLKAYYSKYAFKTVNRREFISTAENIYGDNLTDFFENWMQSYSLPPLK